MGSAAVCEAPVTRSASACEDRRITRSKRALRQALIALLEERGFDSITVNDLCDRADLNRGTFYNHFRDKENLLAVLEDEVMADIAALQERMQRISLADMLAYRVAGTPLPLLVDLFDYLREQSDFLHAVLGPGGDVRFAPRLREAVCEPGAEHLARKIPHESYSVRRLLCGLLRVGLFGHHHALDRARNS